MTSGKHEFKIDRVFDAPRQLVWNAFTQPGLMMKWWGPETFTSPSVKIDFRVGGKYLSCMRGPDGKDYWSGGTYKEIVPLEKIVCTDSFVNENGEAVDPTSYGFDPVFPKEQNVTFTFEALGEKTKLTILYIVESEAVLEVMRKVQMREGWESSLDKLARSLPR